MADFDWTKYKPNQKQQKFYDDFFMGGRRSGKTSYAQHFGSYETYPLKDNKDNIKQARNFNNLPLINLWFNSATKTWERKGGLNP